MTGQPTRDSIQIARLEEQFSAMRHALDEMAEAQRQTQHQLSEMRMQLEAARGGWRTLMWLGGAAASFGAFTSWAASHVRIQ
jgi:TolA-binding protein